VSLRVNINIHLYPLINDKVNVSVNINEKVGVNNKVSVTSNASNGYPPAVFNACYSYGSF
jgi:hypothetical protein